MTICLENELGEIAANLVSLTLFATEDQSHQFPMLSYVPWLGRSPSLEGIDVISGVVARAQSWKDLTRNGWRPIMMQELQFLSNSHAILEHALNLMGQPFGSETFLVCQRSRHISVSFGKRAFSWECVSSVDMHSGQPYMGRISPGSACVERADQSHHITKAHSSCNRGQILTHTATRANKSFSLTLDELQRKGLLYNFTTHVSIHIGDPAFFGRAFDVNVWDLIDGVSQAIFSPGCDHRQDSRAGAIGENFLLLKHDRNFESYELGDQSLLIDHGGDAIFQMLRRESAAFCTEMAA